jgi:two-component system, OmpR family, sensor histidine kinase BaeS
MRLRLILSFVLIVFIAIASVLIIARRQTTAAVRVFMYRGGLTGTEGLVTTLEDYYARNGSWDGVTKWVDAGVGRGRGIGQGNNTGMGMMSQRLQLADANGDILVDTGTDTPSGTLTRLERSRSVQLSVDDEVVGYLYPEGSMAFSQVAESNLISRLNRAAITAALMASGVALVVALFLSYRLLRPVRELTRAARQLAAGDLSQRVVVRGDDELATLANTFNQMAVSLQQVEERRRAMTADIAHELRTPLSVQRAHLEALDDGIYQLSLESLKPIEEQNHLLTRLVDDLRTLALADSGQLELVRTPTDFPALIRRVTAGLEPRAADRQIELQLTLDESCPSLSLDAQRIKQILHNLLDNALRYTSDGGAIRVQLSVGSGQCLLTVRDSGPGIPAEALPFLFERFYRVDRSRSRYEGGTGLGLSIARKIAQTHGGDLTAANHPEGGAVFSLNLPL